MASGHPDAWEYPLGWLADEAQLVTERINGLMATEGSIIQAAAASVMSKEGAKHFNGLIKSLIEGT